MRFLRILLLSCVIALAVNISTSNTAWALLNGLFDKKQAVQAPQQPQQYYIHDEESFKAVEKSFHGIPFKDPQLEFSILLPKDWTSEETVQTDMAGDLSLKLIGDLAKFKSPIINTQQAVVTIQSIKLSREISAQNWLKNYILSNNYDIQDKVISTDDRKASAYCIATSDNKSSYIYLAVEINGNNAIIVQFSSPLALKDTLQFLRKKVVDSFKFILATDSPIETQKNFSFADAVKFNYPESWSPNHMDIKDSRSMSMQLYSKGKNDRIDGLVRFVVIKRNADTSLKAETADLKKYFTDFLSLDFKKLVSSDKAPVTDRFIFSRYEVYQAASKKENTAEQEIHLVVLGDKDWYIFGFLLTPTETDNFYTWACNTQAFNMIIKSLR